jgi:hypothetical protein
VPGEIINLNDKMPEPRANLNRPVAGTGRGFERDDLLAGKPEHRQRPAAADVDRPTST